MGKQIGGINGPYQGKVGTVVGYQWRGQWVVRALPREFHDAKTEKQLEQRTLFKATVAFAGRLKDILRLGFAKSAAKVHKTECNYFLMVNKGCFIMDGEALAVDYENLRVSEGPVAPVAFGTLLSQPQAAASSPNLGEQLGGLARISPSMPASIGGTVCDRSGAKIEGVDAVGGRGRVIEISFEKNPEHRNCNSNDRVYVAAVNAMRGEAVLSLPVYRRMQRITVALPGSWEGEEVHLYGFVQDLAGRTSESTYIGEVSELLTRQEEAGDTDFSEEGEGLNPLPGLTATPPYREGTAAANESYGSDGGGKGGGGDG